MELLERILDLDSQLSLEQLAGLKGIKPKLHASDKKYNSEVTPGELDTSKDKKGTNHQTCLNVVYDGACAIF